MMQRAKWMMLFRRKLTSLFSHESGAFTDHEPVRGPQSGRVPSLQNGAASAEVRAGQKTDFTGASEAGETWRFKKYGNPIVVHRKRTVAANSRSARAIRHSRGANWGVECRSF